MPGTSTGLKGTTSLDAQGVIAADGSVKGKLTLDGQSFEATTAGGAKLSLGSVKGTIDVTQGAAGDMGAVPAAARVWDRLPWQLPPLYPSVPARQDRKFLGQGFRRILEPLRHALGALGPLRRIEQQSEDRAAQARGREVGLVDQERPTAGHERFGVQELLAVLVVGVGHEHRRGAGGLELGTGHCTRSGHDEVGRAIGVPDVGNEALHAVREPGGSVGLGHPLPALPH